MTRDLDADVAAQLRPDLEVVRPLGEGESALVYLAREPALERLVAVKILRRELAADSVACRRFEREARSAARISHPHVTHIHRIGHLDDRVPYIVMEYIDGRTLRDVLESRHVLDPSEARAILAAIASALAAAHAEGIIHRDVRPENVFLESRSGRPVLADFGIAALRESGSQPLWNLTAEGVRLGQVRYLSPEQVGGERATEESDIYALGILAYEILVGEGPYLARSDSEALVAHLRAEPRPLRSLRSDVHSGLAEVVVRCLAKDPRQRPLARELASALSSPADEMYDAEGTGAPGAPNPGGPLAEFLAELRHRRVYKVAVAYGAVALALLGGSQSFYEAFELPRWSYQALVVSILAGFPLALVLSWIYDVSAAGIQRTRSAGPHGRWRAPLAWISLGLSVLVVLALGWMLLRRG